MQGSVGMPRNWRGDDRESTLDELDENAVALLVVTQQGVGVALHDRGVRDAMQLPAAQAAGDHPLREIEGAAALQNEIQRQPTESEAQSRGARSGKACAWAVAKPLPQSTNA